MKREFSTDVPELMDITQADAVALENDLNDLERLNVRFGGHELVRLFLARWIESGNNSRTKWRLLDLATASGDIPRMIVDWARARKIEVEIDAVDFNKAALEIARRRSAAYPEINYIHADMLEFCSARTGAGANGAGADYDIVICSQVLHHFSEADAVCVLKRCAALSRGSVLVSDLRRWRGGQMVVWFMTSTIFRARMMKHDARLSIRRAFAADELSGLARDAGWMNFGFRKFFPVRHAIWLDSVPPRITTAAESYAA